MGKASRDKGMRGQQELARALGELFPGLDFHSGSQYRNGGDTPDIVCKDYQLPLWLECKRGRKVNVRSAFKQAEAESDGRAPVVMWRDDRGKWRVDLALDDIREVASAVLQMAIEANEQQKAASNVIELIELRRERGEEIEA